MSRKKNRIQPTVDMTDGDYQFKTKTIPGETLGARRKRYKCEVCHDTGWYGDNGPGLRGNQESQPCDQCPDVRAKAEMEQDVELRRPKVDCRCCRRDITHYYWVETHNKEDLCKECADHRDRLMEQNESARFKEALRDVRAKMREIKYYHGTPRRKMLLIADDVTARIEEALKD